MKFTPYALLALLSLTLAACGSKTSPEEKYRPPVAPVLAKGELGGSEWTFGNAVAFRAGSRWSVLLAGKGKAVTCSYVPPEGTYLAFSVPAEVGIYEYEQGNPAKTEGRVEEVYYHVDRDYGEHIDATTSSVDLKSIDNPSGTITGGVSFYSDRMLGGRVGGWFLAEICTVADQLQGLPQRWIGRGEVTSDQRGAESGTFDLTFDLGLTKVPNSPYDILSVKVANNQTSRTYFQFHDFLVNDSGVYQQCNGGEVRKVGNLRAANGTYGMALLDAKCAPTGTSFTFHATSGYVKMYGTFTSPSGPVKLIAEGMVPRL